MNKETANGVDPEEEPGIATSGETWSRQVFRALMTPAELEVYQRALAGELPPDMPPTSFGGSSWQGLEQDVWAPSRSKVLLYVFTWAFKSAYWGAHLVAPLLRRPPRVRAAGEPLRVLRLVSVISQGGVAKVCQQTLLPMRKEDVENHMLVFGEKKGTTPELEKTRPDIKLIQRKLLLWPGSFRWQMIRNIWKLARLLRRVRPDVIHLHEPQFAPAARAAALLAGGIPLCVHLHNDYNERRRSIRDSLLALTKHALRESHLIACSRTILEAGKFWLGETRHPWELIEDGSDDVVAEHIDDGLPEKLAQAAAGRRIVAMMAHLVPHKRIEDFMSGCRILLDEGAPIFVLLMAYGRKRQGRTLRKRFTRLFAPHEGEFLYAVKSPQRVLGQVAIGVSTSVLEGLGLNVLEYQIEGVPVVCTDLMPHREMVTDGETGLLFPGYNLPEFLRHMRRLLADEALARKLGEAGRDSARQRTWTKTAAHTVEFYRQVLQREGRG